MLTTLFDLGRQVTAVLDFEELLSQIPKLIARLIEFDAFAVYLLDERRGELLTAYAVGYPDSVAPMPLKRGRGLVGAAVTSQMPLLVNDVTADARYVTIVPGMASELVVPLLHKKRPIGALNILSHHKDQFTAADVELLRQFAAHVAVGIVNARLFETQPRRRRRVRDAGRDRPRRRLGPRPGRAVRAHRAVDAAPHRLPDVRHLARERGARASSRSSTRCSTAIRCTRPASRSAKGSSATRRCTRNPCSSPTSRRIPRYINVVPDVRSELAIPMMLKDRCIGVLDLESPELDAFTKRDVEILTVLASQAAVAIENARLYETVRANEVRLEKEMHFAQRVQAALLPMGLPKRMKGVEVGARFAPARELGGDFHDFLSPEANMLAVALGDVSGKGVPAALYSVFAAELIRGRTFRRRYRARSLGPGRGAVVGEHHPAPAAARGVLLHPLLRHLRPEAPRRDARQLGPAVPDPRVRRRRVARSSCPACRWARSTDRPTTS